MAGRAVSKIILLIMAVGLIWFGVGFLAYAIWAGLTPPLGQAWAAALTAFILLIGPLSASLALGLRRRRPKSLFGSGGEETMAAIFTTLVKDKPLLLLLGAALLGAADAFFKKRK